MSAVAEALPSDEVPEISVEKVPVVNEGLGVIAMVLVPEKRMLAPALKYESGELKNDDHCVVEEVSGMEYPAEGATEKVCVPVEVEVVMKILTPFPVEVARDCDATVLPFNDVIVPPAPPASVPQ